MTARRVLLIIGGILLIASGTLWTLQGIGMVGGSAMTGVVIWTIVGPIVALAGVLLLVRARRR